MRGLQPVNRFARGIRKRTITACNNGSLGKGDARSRRKAQGRLEDGRRKAAKQKERPERPDPRWPLWLLAMLVGFSIIENLAVEERRAACDGLGVANARGHAVLC